MARQADERTGRASFKGGGCRQKVAAAPENTTSSITPCSTQPPHAAHHASRCSEDCGQEPGMSASRVALPELDARVRSFFNAPALFWKIILDRVANLTLPTERCRRFHSAMQAP